MEYGTIKIPAEEYERHNERRKDMGLSWVEYINGQAPDGPVPPEEFEELRDEVSELRESVEESPVRLAESLASQMQSGGPR